MSLANTPPKTSLAASFDDSKRKRRPEDYAAEGFDYSTWCKDTSLHPGIHYRSFALFLKDRLRGPNSSTATSSKTALRPHTFAALHDLAYEVDDPRRVTLFDGNSDLDQFAASPLPHNDCGQLLFLCGHPSEAWINLVGERYRVDPEFFRRHLTLDRHTEFYEIPGPASSSQNIVRLSFTSIGKRNPLISHSTIQPSLRDHQMALGNDPQKIGESTVRRYAQHGQEFFSIEQDIGICVLRRAEGWIAIILLDSGRDLDDSPAGPWLSTSSLSPGFESVFHPIIQYEPNICFKDKEKLEQQRRTAPLASRRRFRQSSSLLHTKIYGQFLSPSLMKSDAFYALHEVFDFTAASKSQFLNMLRAQFESEMDLHDQEEYIGQTLQGLKKHSFILHQETEQLRSIIAIIEEGGHYKWPKAKHVPEPPTRHNLSVNIPTLGGKYSVSTLAPVMTLPAQLEANANCFDVLEHQLASQRLLKDYRELLRRAQGLAELYNDGMRDIRNSAMLAESRKAMEQAQSVTRLTLLAFFFLPLTLTSSMFGMNVRQLSHEPNIWIWVVVSIPVFLFSLVLCYWGSIVTFLFHTYCDVSARAKAKKRLHGVLRHASELD